MPNRFKKKKKRKSCVIAICIACLKCYFIKRSWPRKFSMQILYYCKKASIHLGKKKLRLLELRARSRINFSLRWDFCTVTPEKFEHLLNENILNTLSFKRYYMAIGSFLPLTLKTFQRHHKIYNKVITFTRFIGKILIFYKESYLLKTSFQ
jgi:hypothetical protein